MGELFATIFIAVTFVVILIASGISGYEIASGISGYEEGYKKGQIDAINGIVKYELRKEDDGEMKWAEKD